MRTASALQKGVETLAPVWISHRGYRKIAEENTLAAFFAAVSLGFKHLETDLRVTADNHLVLSHDPDLKRLTGNNSLIRSLSRNELANINLKNGDRLLFFDEFASHFAAYHWVLDIKPESGHDTIAALIKWVQANHAEAWITENAKFLLWDKKQQSRLAEFLPNAKFYAQESECWRAGLAILMGLPLLGAIQAGRTYSLPPRLWGKSLFNKRLVDSFHALGSQVIAFLADNEGDQKAAVQAGFDEILTNIEPLVLPPKQ